MGLIRNLIIFILAFVLFSLALLPVRLFIQEVQLTENVNVQIQRGTVWGGTANIFLQDLNSGSGEVLLGEWQACLSQSFPFVGVCWLVEGVQQRYTARLVGLPEESLRLEALQSRLSIAEVMNNINQISGIAIPPSVELLRLRGDLEVAFNELELDIVRQFPLNWDGRMVLRGGGFFNIDLPQMTVLFNQEEFISASGESGDSFGAQRLPTIRLQGTDEAMDLVGNIQFLADDQVKVSMEITARNNLVASTFAPIATNREGNRFFFTYQGGIY